MNGCRVTLVWINHWIFIPWFCDQIREKRKKVNVKYNNDDTVDYEMQRFWHFRSELSKGSESDEVMALNAVAAVSEITPDFSIPMGLV
jgi:acid phosphatase class B